MCKQVAIVSGKGGVGKTTIAALMALGIADKGKGLLCVDCDVDASNLPLLLNVSTESSEPMRTGKKAAVDPGQCDGCGECARYCHFGAISVDKLARIDPMACEGCGACTFICSALTLQAYENTTRMYGHGLRDIPVFAAQLNMGEAGSGKIVTDLREKAEKENPEITLIDGAAGIGCPVIASLTGVDHVVVVADPHPSAIADLRRLIQLIGHFSLSASIIINRADMQRWEDEITAFAREKGLEILGRFPHDMRFIEASVSLDPSRLYEAYRGQLSGIIKRLEDVSNR